MLAVLDACACLGDADEVVVVAVKVLVRCEGRHIQCLRLARLLGRAKRQAIRFNEHLTGDGPTVFKHVCRMGLEGIVSKRLDAPYRSGPSRTWLKSKNPASEAVRREREEEWR